MKNLITAIMTIIGILLVGCTNPMNSSLGTTNSNAIVSANNPNTLGGKVGFSMKMDWNHSSTSSRSMGWSVTKIEQIKIDIYDKNSTDEYLVDSHTFVRGDGNYEFISTGYYIPGGTYKVVESYPGLETRLNGSYITLKLDSGALTEVFLFPDTGISVNTQQSFTKETKMVFKNIDTVQAGGNIQLKILFEDEFGQTVTGNLLAEFSIVSGTGTIQQTSCWSNVDGIMTNIFTASETTGDVVVKVSHYGVDSVEFTIHVVPVTPPQITILLNDGDLVKAFGNNSVYLLKEGVLHPFSSMQVYLAMGYPSNFSTLKSVPDSQLIDYVVGDPL